ncbi:hypothetical protein BAY61_12030 [Prauserella marina]|uniref:DoxX-like family protein n=1 Tax=Prauserella marina TaxID=530584 RepID=A0A222VNV4_9PSEU|nr:DoxX family protein [Prauserella marina]ASR35605.1 hypothetical protein BAY61_12030 [Prauserella marina]PWV84536.1 DoxX-like protein [Prauserella marina]SDC19841.1 DoxX-like family protein [Prauserella marina]
MTPRTWPTRLGTAAYWIVAMAFLVGAVTKYLPGETFFGPPYSVKFADWGYPPWFRFVVGTLELICAALLVIPDRRTRFAGSAALVLLLTGAVTTHIVNQDALSRSLAAPVNLVIVAVIALVNWPADWRDLLRADKKSPRADSGRPVARI